MNYFNILRKKISERKAIICIIGLGYVGSAIFQKLNKENFPLIGIDKNRKKLTFRGKKNKIILSSNYKHIKNADIIIITLPTPLTKNMKPDLSFIKSCLKSMEKFLKKGQLISLESTTYPGTTDDIIGSFLKKRFKISRDFFLVYSPERISPELKVKNKKIKYNLSNTPKICAGYSKKCVSLGKDIYRKITNRVVTASTLKVAETSKMIENIFRSINIALVNELKMFLTKIDIDVDEALDLAGTKPFGFTKFKPGPGYGGHCIPLDPFYLYWLAKKNNFDLKFIKTSGVINRQTTNWISEKITKFIEKNKIKLFSKKILLLGVAYKPNIDDTRESPAFKIAEKLFKKGYDFEFSDPYVKKIKFRKKLKKSKKINANLFKKFPVVLIVTDHNKFDFNFVSKKAKFLFDSRNIVKKRSKNYFKV